MFLILSSGSLIDSIFKIAFRSWNVMNPLSFLSNILNTSLSSVSMSTSPCSNCFLAINSQNSSKDTSPLPITTNTIFVHSQQESWDGFTVSIHFLHEFFQFSFRNVLPEHLEHVFELLHVHSACCKHQTNVMHYRVQ